MVLNVTSGDGTDEEPYVASLGPFSQARVIAVAIQATGGAGGFSTALSAPSGAVVVGECRRLPANEGRCPFQWGGGSVRICLASSGARSASAEPPTTTAAPSPCCAGTPAKPTISQALGSNGLSATVTFAKSFTATSYTILLVDVTNPTNNKSEVLSPQEADNGPWEHTLTAPAKATYRFEVRPGAAAGVRC